MYYRIIVCGWGGVGGVCGGWVGGRCVRARASVFIRNSYAFLHNALVVWCTFKL